MGPLNEHGKIAIGLLIAYPFVFILSLILVLRHGISRQKGWLFLLTFSLAKIVGSSLLIIAEKQSNPSTTLLVTAYAIEGAGLAPLLQCSMSLLSAAGSSIIDSHPIVTQGRLRIVHLLIAGGIGLTIVGAEMTGSTDESKRDEGSTFRKIGGVILVVDVIILTLVDWVFWQAKHEFMEYQRTLLKSILIAMPFLAVRVVYITLSAFAPSSSLTGTSGSDSGLSKFNSVSGSWQLFLFMDVLTEFIVVVIYIFSGLRAPISRSVVEYEGARTFSPGSKIIPLHPQMGPGSYHPMS